MLQRRIISKEKSIEQGFPTIIVGYATNEEAWIYRMYNTATKRVILTSPIERYGFDGANSANDPTLFDFTESTG